VLGLILGAEGEGHGVIRSVAIVFAAIGTLAFSTPAIFAQSSYVDLSTPMTGKSRFMFNVDGTPAEMGVRSTPEEPAGVVGASGAQGGAPSCGGSSYGSISCITGKPKTLQVRSYERRDGTVVRGHARSRR
jgi:hypothetical protein